MRRQRYSHTLCSQDDNSQQTDSPEEEQLSYDSFYLPVSQPILSISQETLPWQQYSSLELNSGSRFFSVDSLQPSYSNISGSNNSSSFYFNSSSSFNNFGEQYQEVYSNHSLGQASYNPEFYLGATGDTLDLNNQRYNGGTMGPQAAGNDYEGHYQNRSYSPALLQPQNLSTCYPAMSSFGTVFLVLRNCIRVDLSAEKAIFVTNYPGGCVGVMNDTGDQSCIIHPNGKIWQDSSNVHMETGNKAAKFCRRGVVFSSRDHSLAYLVDPSGTKSTSDRFKDLTQDFAFNVFLNNSSPSRQFEQQSLAACYNHISEATYRSYNNGDEVWIIGGIRIKQNYWGEVRISANFNRRVLRTSPTINSMSIATPFVFMKISCHPFRHFVVRRGEKAVCAGSTGMAVQNGSQKAGFDRAGRLILF